MSSNYPPGVTGNEEQIAGHDAPARMPADRKTAGLQAQAAMNEANTIIQVIVSQAKALNLELGNGRILQGPPRGTQKIAAALSRDIMRLRKNLKHWAYSAKEAK